jgi:CDP-diacylglycerol pyrophosphatase
MRNFLRFGYVLMLLVTTGTGSSDPDVLWAIVHDRCVPGTVFR